MIDAHERGSSNSYFLGNSTANTGNRIASTRIGPERSVAYRATRRHRKAAKMAADLTHTTQRCKRNGALHDGQKYAFICNKAQAKRFGCTLGSQNR